MTIKHLKFLKSKDTRSIKNFLIFQSYYLILIINILNKIKI